MVESLVLWVLVVVLGVTLGAGAFEARVIVPMWRSTAPPTWVDTGRRFWAFVTTGPLTLLTLLSLILVWTADGPRQEWWLACTALLVLDRAGTFGYFIPEQVRMRSRPQLDAEVLSRLDTWSRLNLVRLGIDLAALLAAIRALVAGY